MTPTGIAVPATIHASVVDSDQAGHLQAALHRGHCLAALKAQHCRAKQALRSAQDRLCKGHDSGWAGRRGGAPPVTRAYLGGEHSFAVHVRVGHAVQLTSPRIYSGVAANEWVCLAGSGRCCSAAKPALSRHGCPQHVLPAPKPRQHVSSVPLT